jgi:hypothetical protein
VRFRIVRGERLARGIRYALDMVWYAVTVAVKHIARDIVAPEGGSVSPPGEGAGHLVGQWWCVLA